MEGYERLKVSFRTWRDLQARRQDTTFIEQDAAFYADTGVFRPRPAAKSPAAVGAA